MDNVVTLFFNSVIYDIEAFEGIESLNVPFRFKISLLLPFSPFDNAIGKKILLSVPSIDNNKRQWSGLIESIETKTLFNSERITLTINHPLHQLSEHKKLREFYQKKGLEIACNLLEKHHIDFELLGLQLENFNTIPLLHQSSEQSDLDFFHYLLRKIGVMYVIKENNILCLFKHLSFLGNLKTDLLHYLPGQKNLVQGMVHFYSLTYDKEADVESITPFSNHIDAPQNISHLNRSPDNKSVGYQIYGSGCSEKALNLLEKNALSDLSRNRVRIRSGLSHLAAGKHVNITTLGEKNLSGWHVIENVFHYFQSEKEGYHNEATLRRTHDFIPVSLLKKPFEKMHFSTIFADENSANLNRSGNYQYQLSKEAADNKTQQERQAQPYIPRLSSYAGTQLKGIHFPLQKNDEILIAYLDDVLETPFILANIDNAYQKGRASLSKKDQSILSPTDEMALLLNDDHDNNYIQLKANTHQVKLSAALLNQAITFDTSGVLQFKAKRNISFKADRGQLSIKHNAIYHAKESYKTAVHNDYYEKTLKATYIKSQDYHLKTQHRAQIKADNIHWKIEKSIALSALKGSVQFQSPKLIKLETKQLECLSKNKIEMGVKQSFLQHNNGELNFHSKDLKGKASDPIAYFGKINQVSPEIKLSKLPPILKTKLIAHKSSPLEHATSFFNPTWSSNAVNIEDTALACFQIRGYQKGDRGRVIIYECTANDNHKINTGSRLEDDPNETIKEIASLKFKVGDTSLYTFAFEYNNDPGTASIKVPWIYQNQPKSNNELSYYRFEIELLSKRKTALSEGMQWLKNIEINHKQHAKVHALKVIRTQIANLVLSEKDPSTGKTIRTPLKSETIQPLIDNKALIENLPINTQSTLFLLSETGDILEVISADNTLVSPFYEFTPTTDKKEKREIHTLHPPVILNLNDVVFNEKTNEPQINKPSDQHARLTLTNEELTYFKENGNNVTIFIHGFNVPYGKFGKKLKKILYKENVQHIRSQNPLNFKAKKAANTPYDFQLLTHEYDVNHTVKQRFNYLDQLDPEQKKEVMALDKESGNEHLNTQLSKKFNDQLNGTDMHSWIVEFEDNLNRAAGFNEDYRDFSRALFIAWPGEPKSPADYMAANAQSKNTGRAFAEVLLQLRTFSPTMEINIIAHSQGNGVMLSAFDYLGEFHPGIKTNHAFCWQAALPYTALNGESEANGIKPEYLPLEVKQKITRKRKQDPWYLPFAYKGSDYFTVLYSKNDNIVGKVIEQKEQPKGINEKEVFARKPLAEYIAGVFTTYLGLGSLYEAANQLSIPATHLLDEKNIDDLWRTWVQARPYNQVSLFNDKGKFIKYATLDPNLKVQQKILNDEKVIHHFFKTIAQRIKTNKPLLDEKLSWVDNDLYLKMKGIKFILSHIEIIDKIGSSLIKGTDNFSEYSLGFYHSLLLAFSLEDQKTLNQDLTPIMPWLIKIITFVYCTEIGTTQKPINGMGWYGADISDPLIEERYKKKHLHNINCTAWIWHHSDMKVPSKDIMKYIYQEQIMNQIHFGKYLKYSQDIK